MNAFIRFKLTLTEDNPTIRPYFEAEWAKHEEAQRTDLSNAIKILEGVHARWSLLLDEMKREQFDRTYQHPEYGKSFNLVEALQNYDWHCRHHLSHISQAIRSNGLYL